MKYLILSLLVVSMSAFSADKMKSTTKSTVKTAETGTLDINPKDKTEEITDQTPTLTDKEFVKAHITCKTKDGHELKQGDKEYEACLKKVKADKKNTKDPKADVEVKFEK